MPLSRLLYYSENQLSIKAGNTLQQLTNLLAVSRSKNERRNVTGALVFDDLWFFQCLEGERKTILSIFEKLKEDERHSNVSLVALEDIPERMFGLWWMGLAMRNPKTAIAFEPFQRNGRLNPEAMSGKDILNLIREVSHLATAHSPRTVTV